MTLNPNGQKSCGVRIANIIKQLAISKPIAMMRIFQMKDKKNCLNGGFVRAASGKEQIMYLTNKTIITFNLPDEYEAQNKFIKTQDMSKWAVHEGSQGITYVHEDRYIIDVRKGADND